MQIQRAWATPLILGVFVVMAGTGLLMFFDLDSHFQKEVHSWLSWGLLSAFVLHVTVNWTALRQHERGSAEKIGPLGDGPQVLALSFLVPETEEEPRPQQLALHAIGHTPLKDLAPLTGRTPEQMLAALQAAGMPARSAEQSLDSLTGADREKEDDAVRLLFAQGKGQRAPAQP